MAQNTVGMKVDCNLRGPEKTLMDCVKEDMREKCMSAEMTYR